MMAMPGEDCFEVANCDFKALLWSASESAQTATSIECETLADHWLMRHAPSGAFSAADAIGQV